MKKSKSLSRAIKQQLIAGVGSFVVTAVIALVVWYQWIDRSYQDELQALFEKTVKEQARQVQSYLTKIDRTLADYSKDEALAKAIRDGDEQQLQQYQKATQSTLKNEFVSLRFFEVDRAQKIIEDESLTNLEKHMINRAEKDQTVKPEVIGKPPYQLMLARSIQGSDDIVDGTALLILNLDVLKQSLSSNASQGAYQITQNIDRVQTVFLSGGVAGNYEAIKQSIDRSHWSLTFTPSDSLAGEVVQGEFFYIALLVIFVVVVTGVAVFAMRWFNGKEVDAFEATKALLEAGKKELEEGIDGIEVPKTDDDLPERPKLPSEESLLIVDKAEIAPKESPAKDVWSDKTHMPDVIFRSYDIRGVVGEELTEELAELIGKAIASEALDQGDQALVVARDGREHSQVLCERLIKGILSTGCDVLDIGLVPTPLMNFAALTSDRTSSGVMVTASHNPKQYNGFKFLIKGKTLSDDRIQAIKQTIEAGNFHLGMGNHEDLSIVDEYVERIFSDVALAGHLHVVVDAANGATSRVAPQLFEELGCDVTPLFCEIDGSFPNHPPNPSDPNNLVALIDKVKEVEADLGIALDGDGDRLVVVTPEGNIIWPDRLMMLFAKDVVSRNPGCDVIFDVKSTRELSKVISSYGGRPIMWKTGHSHMKSKMQETEALLGGEFSGHIFFKERWYGFDDGMYSAARLMEILTIRDQDIDSAFESFGAPPSTPEIIISVDEDKKHDIVKTMIEQGDFGDGKQNLLDGLRIDYSNGWGLVRASNTSAALTLRFEADDAESLQAIMTVFKRELSKLHPDLSISF